MLPDEKGFTLIELMFSLLILLVVSLALMQMTLMAMTQNVKTDLRYEAVNVAEQRMNELRSIASFADPDLAATPPTGTSEPGITRTVRNFEVTYNPTRTIIDINAKSKQITIVVSWTYKGMTYNHGVTSIFMGRQ